MMLDGPVGLREEILWALHGSAGCIACRKTRESDLPCRSYHVATESFAPVEICNHVFQSGGRANVHRFCSGLAAQAQIARVCKQVNVNLWRSRGTSSRVLHLCGAPV
jgi:hypothetical protein